MSEINISLKDQIIRLQGYKTHSSMMGYRMDVELFKAILASLKELKQMQGKCRWTQDEYHQWSGCGNSFHKLDDCSDKFVYCPYCKKEIEWVEEK